MSIAVLARRKSTKARIMAGERVHWVFNHKTRSAYLLAIVMSAPPWVDAWELEVLRAWARARTVFEGELHVLDHIVPVTHDRVCGLTVPWNLQVIHWQANGAKSNHWCPEQEELFP